MDILYYSIKHVRDVTQFSVLLLLVYYKNWLAVAKKKKKSRESVPICAISFYSAVFSQKLPHSIFISILGFFLIPGVTILHREIIN